MILLKVFHNAILFLITKYAVILSQNIHFVTTLPVTLIKIQQSCKCAIALTKLKLVCDRQTDRQTDIANYRCAIAHKKQMPFL